MRNWVSNIIGVCLVSPSMWLVNSAFAQEHSVLNVELTNPSYQSMQSTVEATGRIATWQKTLVSSEVSGLAITKLAVDVGDEVTKGQILVTLNVDTPNAELKRYQASLDVALATLARAKSNADRVRKLQGTGAMSLNDISTYLFDETAAQASVRVSEAEVAQQKIYLGKTRILAPDDGVVISREASLGQVVNVGDALYTLQRKGKVEWLAEINASELDSIKVGNDVTLQLSDVKKNITGKIDRIEPVIDSKTNRAKLHISLNSNSYKAGMFLTGSIVTQEKMVMVLPISSVVFDGGEAYVFSVDDHHKCKRVPVSIGAQHQQLVEIISNTLDEQSHIVSSGASFLNDADTVTVTQGKAK